MRIGDLWTREADFVASDVPLAEAVREMHRRHAGAHPLGRRWRSILASRPRIGPGRLGSCDHRSADSRKLHVPSRYRMRIKSALAAHIGCCGGVPGKRRDE